jgi:hypothetical protein
LPMPTVIPGCDARPPNPHRSSGVN